MTELPTLALKRGHDRRVRAGAPWVFANEVEMTDEVRRLEPGTLAVLLLPGGRHYGLVHVNPHSLITGRVLTRNLATEVDAAFFKRRFERCSSLRERFVPGGFYRLVHGEGDALPGLVVDRYGDVVVIQPNSAGMDGHVDAVCEAIDDLLAPSAIVVRRDGRARQLEGLATTAPEVRGSVAAPIKVREGGLDGLADPVGGQKTGWFFDQRPNRETIGRLSRGRRVLDLYSYVGGFALHALEGDAGHVTAVDRSAEALGLAHQAAGAMGSAARLETITGDVFDVLGAYITDKARFDIVICDPPPFARSRKDIAAAARGYRKLARAAAAVTTTEGLLATASCSHHFGADALLQSTLQGLRDAGRSGRVVRIDGPGPDHPLHPALPETRYLSFILFALD